MHVIWAYRAPYSYTVLFSFSSVQLPPHTRPRCPHRWRAATAVGQWAASPLPRAPSPSPRLTWSPQPNRKAPLPRWCGPAQGAVPLWPWACRQLRAWEEWVGGGLTKSSTRPVHISPTESSQQPTTATSVHCQSSCTNSAATIWLVVWEKTC